MTSKLPVVEHLTAEEVDYELQIRDRGESVKLRLETKQRMLRDIFKDDLEANKHYTSIFKIEDDHGHICEKVKYLAGKLERCYDEACVSRLKHYYLRAKHSIAEDEFAVGMRQELASGIRKILRHYCVEANFETSQEQTIDQDGATGTSDKIRINFPGTPVDNSGDKVVDLPSDNGENQASNSLGARKKDLSYETRSLADADRENQELRGRIEKLEGQLLRACLAWSGVDSNLLETAKTGDGTVDKKSQGKTQFANDVLGKDDSYKVIPTYEGNRKQKNRQQRDTLWDFRRQKSKFQDNFTDFESSGSEKDDRTSLFSTPNRKQHGKWENRAASGASQDPYEGDSDADGFFRPRRSERGHRGTMDNGNRSVNRQNRTQGSRNRQRREEIPRDASPEYDSLDERDRRNRNPGRRTGNARNRNEYRRHDGVSEFDIKNADRRMEKWHLTFSGPSKGESKQRSLEDFLHKIRRLAKMDRISDEILLMRIHTILRGEAYNWYLCYAEDFTGWDDFEKRFRYMYGNPNKDQGNRQKIYDRKQDRNETFLTFKMEIERLNKLLTTPLDTGRLFEIMWDNMRQHYRTKLACRDVFDLESLEFYAVRIDAHDPVLKSLREGPTKTNGSGKEFTRSQKEGSSKSAKFVNNIEAEDDSEDSYSAESEHEEVNLIAKKGDRYQKTKEPHDQAKKSSTKVEATDSQGLVCWNCRKKGHVWRECTEEKTRFCYTCGTPGKTSITCSHNSRSTSTSEN